MTILRTRTNVYSAVGIVLLAGALGVRTSAADQRAPSVQVDPSAALLAEVRALRAELADATRVSLRAQMLVARVQIQEQRIIYLDRRRTEISAKAADAAEKTQEHSSELQSMKRQIEFELKAGSPRSGPEAADVQRQVELLLAELTAKIQAAQADEQRLRTEEADLASALSLEQGRWSDFNARLDELERALPQR